MTSQPLTLIEHITLAQKGFPEATGAFTLLMESVALAAKIISREVGKAGLGKLMGLAGRRNVQGEDVARLDEFANDTIVHTLSRCGSVCALASEELAVPIRLPGERAQSRYAVVFDPLDGSTNIDVAVSVGTIFGVYRRVSPRGELGDAHDLLQSPGELLAAGYALYGSSTVFVYSAGFGVHGFTLDPGLGEFLLSHPDIKVPEGGRTLSVNVANRSLWDAGTARALDEFENAGGSTATSRYVGSLVADAHRTLLKGGLFAYPADSKNVSGKLRLLYEAGPMAFLFEQAGGGAIDGAERILDRTPEQLHDRTPLVLAHAEDIERYMRAAGASD